MTVLPGAGTISRPTSEPIPGPAALVIGLVSLVALRWVLVAVLRGDALVAGATFGLGTGILVLAGGWRPHWPAPSAMVAGVLGGGALVAIAALTRPLPHLWLPAAPFAPWLAITVIVAVAEEGMLRGVLFTRIENRRGWPLALGITTILFAAMHVPLYGWQVVPLDLGVGLWLGGLRLATGGAAAPAVAHVLADLATWWL